MQLSNAELLMIVVSPLFVITTTATVRKYIPQIDKWKVVLFVFALSELVSVIASHLTNTEHWLLYGVLSGLLLASVSLGANEKGNQLVDRFVKKKVDETPSGTTKVGPS